MSRYLDTAPGITGTGAVTARSTPFIIPFGLRATHVLHLARRARGCTQSTMRIRLPGDPQRGPCAYIKSGIDSQTEGDQLLSKSHQRLANSSGGRLPFARGRKWAGEESAPQRHDDDVQSIRLGLGVQHRVIPHVHVHQRHGGEVEGGHHPDRRKQDNVVRRDVITARPGRARTEQACMRRLIDRRAWPGRPDSRRDGRNGGDNEEQREAHGHLL
mmetsp:Transcript_40238/g.106553  ORF Transcript_40238/g.106553 Transcript_40238/m.106553 type:complete len:215 (-) Transcript_40238:8-652(-)